MSDHATTSPVPTRKLGHSDLHVSTIGLGCNNFGRRLDLNGTRAVVDACLDAGVTFLDTADIYGGTKSEAFLGEVLQGRRGSVVLATKFGMDVGDGNELPRGSKAYIEQAIDNSLRRLRTDHVDLYWYHRPDGVTPIDETLSALDALVQAGKVRAIGASNFSAAQLEEADNAATGSSLTRFTAVQNEYSLLLKRDPETDGVLDACERLELGFVPYFPLASGLLTGKYTRGQAGPAGARLSERDEIASDAQWALVEALQGYAEERSIPLTEVAIGALLAQRTVVSVIAGATKPEQVTGNARGAAWQPSQDDLSALRTLLDEHPV